MRLALITLLAGCTLFQRDIPDKSCRTDDDCFAAQGERCDQATMECVVMDTPDATPMFDAPPAADAAPADAAPDATVAP